MHWPRCDASHTVLETDIRLESKSSPVLIGNDCCEIRFTLLKNRVFVYRTKKCYAMFRSVGEGDDTDMAKKSPDHKAKAVPVQ